ncbi:MAG: hypothetical protein P8X47_06520, partial [Ignavibacteriaceae bacterium]
ETFMDNKFILYLKAFGIWFILAVSAIIVAIFRNEVLLPPLGEQTAHQIGTILFLIVQFLIIYLFINRIKLREIKTAVLIGIFWLILTVCFEFLFGHYVIGHSWEKLFADYNIFKGRLWLLVLLNNLIAPIISSKLIRN